MITADGTPGHITSGYRRHVDSGNWGGVPKLLVLTWGALFLNVLAFAESATLIPIPSPVGKLATQGALPIALLFALVLNRRIAIRPNLFLVLFTMLAIVALMVSIHNEFMLGSMYRALRMLGFIAVLWLLTPWWGRHDMMLLRVHRWALWAVLGVVIMGALVAPGLAFSFQGRLSGVIWPIPPTQVAHYAAILFGTTLALWLCHVISGKNAAITCTVTAAVLIATHTRTAILALVVGLAVAGASLFLGHTRARRISAMGIVLAVLAATFFAPEVTSWAKRGQTTQEAAQLTGRTKVWSAVFDTPRPRANELFGSGMSNNSFHGLPIDSNWVATFLDQGWFGLIVQASCLALLFLMATTHVRSPRRAVALFIVSYCVVASITETGLGQPSPYMLDLVIAASLLVTAGRRQE